MFKPEDKIICINNVGNSHLKLNKTYNIDRIFVSNWGKRIILKEFPEQIFYAKRFTLDMKSQRDNNIKNLKHV